MAPTNWNPRGRFAVEESYDTSMGTTKVRVGPDTAYIKAMGNRQGPHLLASELVGTRLADWFGLPVAEFVVYPLPEMACFELKREVTTQAGPAFLSRHVDGRTWGGSEAELQDLANQADISRIIVFDTWVRNCDRHPPDTATRKPNYNNVYLADTDRPERSRLYAIDHTHCFDCGRDFSPRLADIGMIRDERSYGLFPAFVPYLDAGQFVWCGAMLRSLKRETVSGIVDSIPVEWDVPAEARTALTDQIVRRAEFVSNRINDGWPFGTAGGATQTVPDRP
jgi:hypothetical protein